MVTALDRLGRDTLVRGIPAEGTTQLNPNPPIVGVRLAN